MKRLVSILLICFTWHWSVAQDTAFVFTYGGIQDEVCKQIISTRDSGFILIGTTNSFGHGATDFYVVKADSQGHHQWSVALGGPMSDNGFSVVQTYDHGYAFLGYTESFGAGGYDAYLIKTDSAGNVKWQKTYGGTDWDFGYSMAQLKDSGFVICGQTYSFGAGDGDVYVIRTDKNGDTLWTRAVGGTGYDVGNSIAVENDSIFAICGSSTSFGNYLDTAFYFIRMSSSGNVERQEWFHFGDTSRNACGSSVSKAIDNGFLLFGYSDTVTKGKPDEMLIHVDSMGNKEWIADYVESGYGYGEAAIQTPDGDILTSSTNNTGGLGGYAMQIELNNPYGYWVCNPSFGGSGDEYAKSITPFSRGGIAFAGSTDSPGYTCGLFDFYVVKFRDHSIVFNYVIDTLEFCDTLSPAGINQPAQQQLGVKMFPVPVRDAATVLLQGEPGERYYMDILNEMGQVLQSKMTFYNAGHDQARLQVSTQGLSTGVDIYNIINKEGVLVATGKFVVE